MISALEPRFEKLESKEKDAKRRQIDRYVLQGEVISLMLAHTPGLVVTVSDLITTPEYDTLWKNRDRSHVLRLDWISQELIQVSESYSESVQSVFRLMQEYFTSNRQPASSQQTSRTLPPSPTEPESGTNAASFCQRATINSQGLVSSYDTSLCSQQPFEGSIDGSKDATKRQKTSGHTTSQSWARRRASQKTNQKNFASSSHTCSANMHREHQAPDIVIAANDLRSLQHGSHSYKGVAAARLPTPDTLDLDGALQGSGNGSTEGRQVSCGDNTGSVLRSCYLPTSGIGRLELDQHGFPGHLDVLQDRQTSDSTMDGLVLINQVSSVDGFDSQQLQIADGLFLSDFMQEYRGIM
ncbi:unnamed protein product [Alternaria alternata]